MAAVTVTDTHKDTKVRKRRRKKKLAEQDDDEYLLKVLATYEGRAVLWKQCAGVFTTSFAGAGYNDVTNFNEGKRQIALGLYLDIERVSPNAALLMRQEAVSRETNQEDDDAAGRPNNADE